MRSALTRGQQRQPDLFNIGTDWDPTTPANRLEHAAREIRALLEKNQPTISRGTRAAVHTLRILAAKRLDETADGTPTFDHETLARRIAALPESPAQGDAGKPITSDEMRQAASLLANCTITDANPEAATAAVLSALEGTGNGVTPINVAKAMVTLAQPQPNESVIDPACGSGTIPALCSARMRAQGDTRPRVTALDKDQVLVHMTSMLMSIAGNDAPNTRTTDSLADLWQPKNQQGTFDVVLLHPPFGNRMTRSGQDLLRHFTLSQRPEHAKKGTREEQALQVLFIEAGLRLLKPSGRMAITLHDGVIGNPGYQYVWDYVESVARIRSVISMPEETFAPEYNTKASLMLLEKDGEREKPIFMAIASTAGRDRRGRTLVNTNEKTLRTEADDEVPQAAANYANPPDTELGFTVPESEIMDRCHIPGMYRPETRNRLRQLAESGRFDMPTIADLVRDGQLEITQGDSPNTHPMEMGEGIPFIRTSDVRGWEMNWHPIMAVDHDEAQDLIRKQDLQPDDILLVCDGDSLIGRTAMVTTADGPMVIQSHIKKLRAKGKLNPHLLIFLLNCDEVQRQFREKIVAQATVSTLGKRLGEVVLPISRDPEMRQGQAGQARRIVDSYADSKRRMNEIFTTLA